MVLAEQATTSAEGVLVEVSRLVVQAYGGQGVGEVVRGGEGVGVIMTEQAVAMLVKLFEVSVGGAGVTACV